MQKFVKPLSLRQQQVLDYRSQGVSFEAIADLLGCSLRAAIEYHRRALGKLQRTNDFALSPLERGESYARRLHKTPAKSELAIAEPPCDRESSALALRERPLELCFPSLFGKGESVVDFSSDYLDVKTCLINLLKIPEPLQSFEQSPDQSKALEGDEIAQAWDFVGRSHSPQTTIIDLAPRHPRRCKSTSRCSRQAGMGFGLTAAS